MWSKKMNLQKEQQKYDIKAKEYLHDPRKAESLIKNAIQKSSKQKGALGAAWEKLTLCIDLIRAFEKGEYRHVSRGTIITILGALIYFVSPVDVVPDFIAGLGIVDDAAVIGFALKKIGAEVDEYKRWKETRANSPLD